MSNKDRPWLPRKFGGFVLYRIYYGNTLVYLGRTLQPLQDRIRGHLFKKPMQRELDINQITKIEYTTLQTEADMYLYEIYYINLWHPPLNKDDKSHDNLTVSLPELKWEKFETKLWEKWKEQIHKIDKDAEEARKRKLEHFNAMTELKRQRRAKEITEEEYDRKMAELYGGQDIF